MRASCSIKHPWVCSARFTVLPTGDKQHKFAEACYQAAAFSIFQRLNPLTRYAPGRFLKPADATTLNPERPYAAAL